MKCNNCNSEVKIWCRCNGVVWCNDCIQRMATNQIIYAKASNELKGGPSVHEDVGGSFEVNFNEIIQNNYPKLLPEPKTTLKKFIKRWTI